MKNIPPNVWQTSLTEDDWNFSQIEKTTFKKNEWEPCLRWELYREKIQAAAGGKFPAQTLVPTAGEDRRIMAAKIAMGRPAGRIVEADWTPYLTRRKKDKWKPFPKVEYNEEMLIELDWHGFLKNFRDQWENDDAIWEGKTEILPFRIPWDHRDEEILSAFAKWLKANRHPELPEPPSLNLTGAGSRPRQAQSILKALAAWRLYQHYKGNRTRAYAHDGACEYLGKTYERPGEWTDARKTVQSRLK